MEKERDTGIYARRRQHRYIDKRERLPRFSKYEWRTVRDIGYYKLQEIGGEGGGIVTTRRKG